MVRLCWRVQARQHGGVSATKAAKLCSRQEHLLIKSRRLVRLGAYLLGEIVQAFRKSLWHFQPVAYETAVALVSLVSVSQFVPRMIPSQKLDSPASALISLHGLNLQPHYPLSRDASSERAPAWLPRIEFPWRITFGAVVTFAVARLFQDARISSCGGQKVCRPAKPHRALTFGLVKQFARRIRNFLLARSPLFC